MPVRKFRSVEEMKQAAELPTGDPSIPSRIRHLWRLASAFPRNARTRGVRKYRSVEQADAARQEWEASH